MTRTPISTESLVGKFRDVRAAHDHGHSFRPNCIGDAIGFRHHPGHGSDADQSNIVIVDPLRDFSLVHGLSIAIDQHHFMAGRGQCLQKKHPEMGHEIARYAVIRVI